jgi:hypothetical protein
MIKKYEYSIFSKMVLLLLLLISLGGLALGKIYGFLVPLISILFLIWFILFGFTYRIMITDEYLTDGYIWNKLERDWNQIEKVSRIFSGYSWRYIIYCKNKPYLTFTFFITNYKELLQEIVNRSPNAIVDDSVRNLLEKSRE